jgi:serine/threonine protein kinase
VHGDIKPTNILFRSTRAAEDLVLSDFGRMRAPDDVSDALAGTLAYMSPEALRAERSSAQDLFALGIVFLQLLGARDMPTLRRQTLADAHPAEALYAAVPRDAFGVHEPRLRAIAYAMLATADHQSPTQILTQLAALAKDLA